MRKAWAIKLNHEEIHGFAGIYCFIHGDAYLCQSGLKTALWETRKDAREALPAVKIPFPMAKVVRVHIHILEVAS